jgi:putative transposase
VAVRCITATTGRFCPSHGVNDDGRRFLQELPTQRRKDYARAPVRVSPTEEIRGEIDALFDGSRDLSEVIEDVARLGARLIIQVVVEAEVEVFLGRARYQRAADCPDARAGSRNGYCESTSKTTAGPVTVARPKLRGTTEAFASTLFGKSVTKSNALESLVIAGFVRGLSVRAEHSGRCARRRGGAVQVDGLAGLPGDRRGVHAVVGAAA